jgi:dihydroorotate dehydrogenase electron transfer subunit
LDRKHPAILVGGGVGITSLVYLSEYLKKKGVRQWVFLGARNERDLVHVEVFRKLKVPLFIATDDGSLGQKGFVTRLLEQRLPKIGLKEGTLIHSCGPRPMFRALAAVAEKFDVPAYLLWEERMGCGLGICLTCVCPVKDGGKAGFERPPRPLTANAGGETGMVRTCVEGPVFEASRIDWERLE